MAVVTGGTECLEVFPFVVGGVLVEVGDAQNKSALPFGDRPFACVWIKYLFIGFVIPVGIFVHGAEIKPILIGS